MKRTKIFEGMKVNRLTAIEFVGTDKNNHALWKFKCDCGKTTIVPATFVVTQNTKSCGCLRMETLKIGQTSIKHGMSKTKIYSTWRAMKSRCVSNKHYVNKGISVCEEWNTFEPFYQWAISNGYSEELTIDRIDNNGNYSPSNCRWATQKQQANNRSTSLHIFYQGECRTLAEWADLLHIKRSTIKSRYYHGDRGERLFRKVKEVETWES